MIENYNHLELLFISIFTLKFHLSYCLLSNKQTSKKKTLEIYSLRFQMTENSSYTEITYHWLSTSRMNVTMTLHSLKNQTFLEYQLQLIGELSVAHQSLNTTTGRDSSNMALKNNEWKNRNTFP